MNESEIIDGQGSNSLVLGSVKCTLVKRKENSLSLDSGLLLLSAFRLVAIDFLH